MDLLTLFDQYKGEIERLSLTITKMQSSLDDIIFEIYDIPSDIAQIIRNNTSIDI